MTTALSTLRQRMSEPIGDWLSSTVTTAINADTSVVDTALANVEGGDTTDFFEDWWILFTSYANDGVKRKISAYNSSTNTLTVQGGNLTDDTTNKATYELHRIHPDYYTRALNMAARDIYPTLYKPIIDRTLSTGNALPNSHFDWWSATTIPDLYTNSANSTCAQTTTAANKRGGVSSCKLTAGAASDYFYITSDSFRRLVDLQNTSIDFYCWVYPEVANDAWIAIYTLEQDGTATTTTSTTSVTAGEYNLVSITSHSVPDDLDEIQFRFGVTTDTKYAYFDQAQVFGKIQYDYVLPGVLQYGKVNKIRIQTSGEEAVASNDVGMVSWADVFGWKIVDDYTYKYLRLPFWSTERLLELEGYAPLEDNLSSDTDTMSIDDPHTELLVTHAIWHLFRQMRGYPSGDGTKAIDEEIAYWASKVTEMKRRLAMRKPSGQISWSY